MSEDTFMVHLYSQRSKSIAIILNKHKDSECTTNK